MSLSLINFYSSQDIPIRYERLHHEDINLVNTKTENWLLDNVLLKYYGRIDQKGDSNIAVTESKK